jgi:NAD(P)-dependent dehydrogenase (short-subunit alcohol dehydrogenase family)
VSASVDDLPFGIPVPNKETQWIVEGIAVDLGLRGKRAIVTGGSRGIGLAVAQSLAAEGADVAIVARHAGTLATAINSITGHSGRIVAAVADTTDDATVRTMVDSVATELGGIDVLVNAAAEPGGAGVVPPLADLTDDDLRVEIETKVLGYLRCARAVAPHMMKQQWGRIINIAGGAALRSGNLVGSIRNVSVVALTKNLADELGTHGIGVTAVHPGLTVTERTPGLIAERALARGMTEEQATSELATTVSIGRLVTSAEVAAVITFLASPMSVAINGESIAVGGGARGPIRY